MTAIGPRREDGPRELGPVVSLNRGIRIFRICVFAPIPYEIDSRLTNVSSANKVQEPRPVTYGAARYGYARVQQETGDTCQSSRGQAWIEESRDSVCTGLRATGRLADSEISVRDPFGYGVGGRDKEGFLAAYKPRQRISLTLLIKL
jgi:hypothetical protein